MKILACCEMAMARITSLDELECRGQYQNGKFDFSYAALGRLMCRSCLAAPSGCAGSRFFEIGELALFDISASGTQHRVMVADDDEITRGLLSKSLNNTFSTYSVFSGQACLAEIAAFKPEVVLLDIEMPGMDGYETCRRLREMHAPNERPAVIFISSHDTLDERLLAYDSGGDDFMAKPFVAEELRRKIAVGIGARIHQRSLVIEKQQAEESVNGLLRGTTRWATCSSSSVERSGVVL